MTANTIRMTYLVLAVIFLHLTVMPITLRIALFVDTDKECGKLSVRLFFVPVFVKSIDVARLGAVLRGEELGDAVAKDGGKERNAKKIVKKPVLSSPIVKYLLRFAWETAKRVRVRLLDTDAIIGIGDAAATAVAVGTLSSFYGQLLAVTDSADVSRGGISPDYDTERIYTDIDGIISLCFADIIYAAIKAVKFNKRENKTYARYISDRA